MSIKALNWAWSQPIKGNQKLVLLALADHTDDQGRCWPGIEGLSAKCGISRTSIIQHIQCLQKLGIITIQKRYGEEGRRQSNIYVLNLSLSSESLHSKLLRSDLSRLSSKSARGRVQNLNGNHHIETSIESPNISRADNSAQQDTGGTKIKLSPLQEIFQYWQATLNHPRAKLDNKRKYKINQALRAYSIEEIKLSIDGCKASAFHQGKNPENKVHDDIELILRDSKHIEQFMGFSKQPLATSSNALAKTFEGAI